jgi:hypothetical protein
MATAGLLLGGGHTDASSRPLVRPATTAINAAAIATLTTFTPSFASFFTKITAG